MDLQKMILGTAGCYRATCEQCKRSILLPLPTGLVEGDPLCRAGWGRDEAGALRCDLCLALGKETQAEAAQAYDAETVARVWELRRRLKDGGHLDALALELIELAWSALDWATKNPGEKVYGVTPGQLSCLKEPWEAL